MDRPAAAGNTHHLSEKPRIVARHGLPTVPCSALYPQTAIAEKAGHRLTTTLRTPAVIHYSVCCGAAAARRRTVYYRCLLPALRPGARERHMPTDLSVQAYVAAF